LSSEGDLARARRIFFSRASEQEIFEERSPRYRATQKKDKKTARRSCDVASFFEERRLLTCGSGEVSAGSNERVRERSPNVSGVSQVGDRRMNLEDAKSDRALFVVFKNSPGFARLRRAVKMIVDVGT
jgi:hypothetical protein